MSKNYCSNCGAEIPRGVSLCAGCRGGGWKKFVEEIENEYEEEKPNRFVKGKRKVDWDDE